MLLCLTCPHQVFIRDIYNLKLEHSPVTSKSEYSLYITYKVISHKGIVAMCLPTALSWIKTLCSIVVYDLSTLIRKSYCTLRLPSSTGGPTSTPGIHMFHSWHVYYMLSMPRDRLGDGKQMLEVWVNDVDIIDSPRSRFTCPIDTNVGFRLWSTHVQL